tara:strand:- start:153 stop:323 length:171 start_codon:yes stop_codon:yes gene_type:complete
LIGFLSFPLIRDESKGKGAIAPFLFQTSPSPHRDGEKGFKTAPALEGIERELDKRS